MGNREIDKGQECLLKKISLQDQWQLKSNLAAQQDLLIVVDAATEVGEQPAGLSVCIQWKPVISK